MLSTLRVKGFNKFSLWAPFEMYRDQYGEYAY